MRIFALSDLHADYEPNFKWLENLSFHDYQADVLILAGDVSDRLALLESCLGSVVRRFKQVLFVPGNHELWTIRDSPRASSFDKFESIRELVRQVGAFMDPVSVGGLSIVPLLSWYDYSFGVPSRELDERWMDHRACIWPPAYGVREVTAQFLALNEAALETRNQTVISFSHFLPRVELAPKRLFPKLDLHPVLGSTLLDHQIRRLRSTIHVYGHSHVNRRLSISGVEYINNAFGYPHERMIARKQLLCVYET